MPYHKRPVLSTRPQIGAARALTSATALALLAALVACGGGGGSSPVATGINGPQPVPAPPQSSASPAPGSSASPAPGSSASPSPSSSPSQTAGSSIVVSPAALAFAGVQAPVQNVSVSQPQNTTGFALTTTTCAKIAQVAPTSGPGPFTVKPLAAGACTYLVTGSNGQTATISISVTTTSVTIQ